MKISISLSFIILAIGFWLGKAQHHELSDLRVSHQRSLSVAEKMGIPVELKDHQTGVKESRPPRDQAVVDLEMLISKSIALIKESATSEDDPQLAKRSTELIKQLGQLSQTDISKVLKALADDASLTIESRCNFIANTLMVLSAKKPATAVALFAESSKSLEFDDITKYKFSASLANWAKLDPLAAMNWLEKNAASYPGLTDDDAAQTIISGAAQKDLKLAFDILEKGDPENLVDSLSSIAETAQNGDQRTTILNELRAHLAKISDPAERETYLQSVLESMAQNLTNENFDSVESWMKTAKLSPAESSHFVSGLSYDETKQDTGRWVEWMQKNIPKDQLADHVDTLVGQWTQEDYIAAGKWLTTAAPGPAKNAAISSYAVTVAEYEPQTAAQWALTLPEGEERKKTLQSIYENWPKNDATAANEFARQHGIKIDRN